VKFRRFARGRTKNLQVNTLQVNTELGGKTGKYPGKNLGKYLVNTR